MKKNSTISIKNLSTSIPLIFFLISILVVLLIAFKVGDINEDREIMRHLQQQRLSIESLDKQTLQYLLIRQENRRGNRELLDNTMERLRMQGEEFTGILTKLKRWDSILRLSKDESGIERMEEIFYQFKVLLESEQAKAGGSVLKRSQALRSNLAKLIELNRELLSVCERFAAASRSSFTILIIIPILMAVGLPILALFLLRRAVLGPVTHIIATISDMAKGNLDSRVEMNREDEIGQLAEAVNQLSEQLKSKIGEIIGCTETSTVLLSELTSASQKMDETTQDIKKMSEIIASSSEEISVNMETVASASEEGSTSVASIRKIAEQLDSNMNTVAAAAEEASVNMKDVSSKVSHISTEIGGVNDLVEKTENSFQRIEQETSKAMSISKEAASDVESALHAMNNLNEGTQEIDNILQMITDISNQTNMLALNATIEAASAGQAGKGFAVVASEVKDLANQTSQASLEIAEKVEQIQQYTHTSLDMVKRTNNTISQVSQINGGISSLVEVQSDEFRNIGKTVEFVSDAAERSAINVQEAANGIREITHFTAETSKGALETRKNIEEAAEGTKEIARSTAEVSLGVKEINQNIQRVDQVVVNAVDAVELNTHAIQQFTDMSTGLKFAVDFFSKQGSTFFYWTDRLSVHNEIIDGQHQQIVDYINQLYSAASMQASHQETLKILNGLIEIAVRHFRTEEGIFKKSEYPLVANHLGKHEDIINQLNDFKEKFEQKAVTIDDSFLDFLKEWLIHHIMTEDKGYEPYI